jgi:benzoylformate decarboxylase
MPSLICIKASALDAVLSSVGWGAATGAVMAIVATATVRALDDPPPVSFDPMYAPAARCKRDDSSAGGAAVLHQCIKAPADRAGVPIDPHELHVGGDGHVTFKKTKTVTDVVPRSIRDVVVALQAVPAKELAIVADYAVGAGHALDALSRISAALDADIYAAPFHVQGTVDPLHPNFRGQLPSTIRGINQVLSRYHTMLLVGEKVDTFTYDGASALPGDLSVIQIAPASSQLGFDYPCDMAVLGAIGPTLGVLAAELDAVVSTGRRPVDEVALERKYPTSGKRPSDALILAVLRHLDRATHIVTEGSSEDAIVQDMAVALGFRNVHFSPRGGGFGWAMPLGVGI